MTGKDIRNYWLEVRRQIIIRMMLSGESVENIANAIGTDHDYTRKTCQLLHREYDVAYCQTSTERKTRLDDTTRIKRSRLADLLYMIRQHRHQIEVAIATGITQRGQPRAMNAPFDYEWSLGEMTGLARLLDVTCGELDIALMHDEANWQRWFKERSRAQHGEPVLSAA